MSRFYKLRSLIAFGWICASPCMAGFAELTENQSLQADSNHISLSTTDRMEDMTWWPTKGVSSRDAYVGTEECAKCHSAKVESQRSTEMAQASSRLIDSAFFRGSPVLNFRQPPYVYEIEHKEDAILYSVSDGKSLLSEILRYAFGKGIVGQTYIYRVDDRFYESRLSYFASLNALDITTGHAHSVPLDLERALGRLLEPKETQKCFGCHTTASTSSNHFNPDQSWAGVTCEACHGPGSRHVAAMKAGRIEEGKRTVLNPGKLDAETSVDFCGACHRTSADVIEMGVSGVVTVRFQPFRLEESRCWLRARKPLTCVTCHDPHEPLVHSEDSYDPQCLRCHPSNVQDNPKHDHRTVSCRVSDKHCVSCHMPKVEIPDMHYAFTDHRIRIVRDSAGYPN
jgi:Cytochrome c554 and c-prime